MTRSICHYGVERCFARSRSPPARDVRPTVVLMPAKLLLLVGQVILPSVSVPSVTAASPMDAAMPEPEEEPQGSAFGKYAFVA